MIEESDKDRCVILTPAGAREAKKRYPEAKIIYLSIPRRTALMRILLRGDDVDEAIRRNMSDVGMFDGFENEADKTLSSNMTSERIAKAIIEW